MKFNIYIKYLIISIIFLVNFIFAGIKSNDVTQIRHPNVWALVNATIILNPDRIQYNSSLVIRDGFIDIIGENILIPKDATIIDMSGNTIYPGFIDSWVKLPSKQNESHLNGVHLNNKVRVHKNISHLFDPTDLKLDKLHKIGFTAAHIVPDSGVFQGNTSVVQLNDSRTVLNPQIAQNLAFEVEGWRGKKYPSALLGVVALIRQTIIDANWYYLANEKIEKFPLYNDLPVLNLDLKILGSWIYEDSPIIFESDDELSALRSFEIANEFDLNIWIKGSGYEYRRIKEFKDQDPFIILPINYPITPDLSNPYQELSYSTSELKHWDIAPDNPAMLEQSNIQFSLTSHEVTSKEFRRNLNRSINRGLSKGTALAALTTIPAKKLGLHNKLGKIEKGYIANLTIVSGDYFEDGSDIVSVWINGDEYPIIPKHDVKVIGKWDLTIMGNKYLLEFSQSSGQLSGKVIKDSIEYKLSNLNLEGRSISWQVKLQDSIETFNRFTGHILEDRMEGVFYDNIESWSAIKTDSIISNESKNNNKDVKSTLSVFYPEGTYGNEKTVRKYQNLLIRNATIWTCGNQGILQNHDILFINGKVEKIDIGIKAPKGTVIYNGIGKHITPGLIDCHSHSAAFSINEGTQSITSEVRIQDVLNSDDITIYRELAGGLTIANILHGSANTIGGQNAVIKLRWGGTPKEILFANAMPGIKFALGENVKQSNWGDNHTSRYPQTRMGVEQILRYAFNQAKDYESEWLDYGNNPKKWKKKIPPRRNLELEALVEILNGKRQIHCHSYRQDEILMLTRIAEDFGFKVGTFQHVLEGYKIADRLKEHGAYASTFSDWWAYKYEVIDAIPYNASLMTEIGVNVSINSDSREVARRMNTEASKGVKYGGMTEEEALKLVTINPAIQLNIDKWVGSLEIGKDADFVIWSDNPLSTKSICEQTWIDGIQYFSLETDSTLKIRDSNIRAYLVNKILAQKGNKKKEWKHHEKQSTTHHHCIEDE